MTLSFDIRTRKEKIYDSTANARRERKKNTLIDRMKNIIADSIISFKNCHHNLSDEYTVENDPVLDLNMRSAVIHT